MYFAGGYALIPTVFLGVGSAAHSVTRYAAIVIKKKQRLPIARHTTVLYFPTEPIYGQR